MTKLILDIPPHQKKRLREIAAREKRSEEDVSLEALELYLRTYEKPIAATKPDPYHPLRQMVGLADEGPADLSIRHDLREGEDA
jgi:hypothetical protein